jgi:hypothetical protein
MARPDQKPVADDLLGDEGVKRYRTEIIAERIQFVPKRQETTHADSPDDDTA